MGCVPPQPGFLEALRSLADATGRAARLRRGDDGLPGRARRRAGALRRHARPDDPREDRRRRPAGGGVRRQRRADGAARAGRRRLPGGNALGEPARDRGGHLRPAPAARPGASTTSSSGSAPASRTGLAPFGTVQRVGAMLTLFCRDGPVARLRGRGRARHRALRCALPAPARGGRLPAALAVRVPVPVDGAHRRARRRDHRRGRASFFDAGGVGGPLPGDRGRAPPRRARSGRPRCDPRTSRTPCPSSRRSSWTGASRSAWRRSTRATSSTTAARGCSPRRTTTSRSSSAMRCSRTGSSGSPTPAPSPPSPTSPRSSRSARRPAPTGATGTAPPGRRRRRFSAGAVSTAPATALRESGDPAPLERLARAAAGDGAVDAALAAHDARFRAIV